MVCKKSEYQKQYKTSIFIKNLPNYVDNLAFRLARKREQFVHTPLVWEDSESTSGSENEVCVHKRSDPLKEGRDNSATGVRSGGGVDVEDQAVQTSHCDSKVYENETVSAEEDHKKLSLLGRPGRCCCGNRTAASSRCSGRLYKLRPDRRQQSPSSARPASVSSSCPKVLQPCRPPFVSYGWADKEDSVAVHKTHNVLSARDVYPSALKALQRLHLAQQHQKRLRKQNREAKKHPSHTSSGSSLCNPAAWETEYRTNFTHPLSARK
ncbi:hypothetical protein BaRGS_00004444 [Batillaria attramentaria]|uniref:Uncharacterized protein n=1 Tax=Batillaria attramentaria TaxID=370345 RepID=A0ABD0LWW7_9CAEN